MVLSRAEIAALCGVDVDDVRADYEFIDRVCAVTRDGVKHWGQLPLLGGDEDQPSEPKPRKSRSR
jgi:hypothetical protein